MVGGWVAANLNVFFIAYIFSPDFPQLLDRVEYFKRESKKTSPFIRHLILHHPFCTIYPEAYILHY
jgi:Fic family protein